MAYFVTGATGFIGRFLVENLLKRGEPVYVLVRKSALKKLPALRETWGADDKQVIAIIGDLAQAQPRRRRRRPEEAQGQDRPLLPSRRDLRSRPPAPRTSSAPTSTARATRSSSRDGVQAGCFHHVSSIAAAGLYDGVFREDMFEEAEDLDHPYFRPSTMSEGIVRKRMQAAVPHLPARLRRRPFEDRLHRQDRRAVLLLQAASRRCATCCRRGCRRSASKAGASTSCRSISSPTRSIISRTRKGLDGKCFHLTDPEPYRIGEVLNIFAKAGACAADDDARQRADVRLHPGADSLRHRLARRRSSAWSAPC